MIGTPRPKVLVLAREMVMHWVPHYIAALREFCDVVTCGPAMDMEMMARENLAYAARWLEPNNIVSGADSLEVILELLPAGWRPELIVTIQSMNPVIRDIARATCPTAYISVDTWHDPHEYIYARGYDHVFVAQKQLVPYFSDAGIASAHWLPLACSPADHYPVDIAPEHGIVFIGTTFYKVNRQRVARLTRLRERFDVGILRGLGGDIYCRALCAARVIFNSSVAQDLNMRVFEAMAIGRPLLTNRDADINGLGELFEEGVHFLGYDDEDLMEQAARLMEDEALREKLTANARAAVLAAHTYRHRMDTLLQTVFEHAAPAPCALRNEPKLSAWLPNGARRVLDVGMGMDRSRVALKRVGVEWLAGLPLDSAVTRSGSYDELLASMEGASGFDTITCAHPVDAALDLTDLLEQAARTLPAGGNLILLLSEAEALRCGLGLTHEAWDVWSYQLGFHLLALHAMRGEAGEALALRFRRYTRTSVAIAEEMYLRFPGGGRFQETGDESPPPA